MILQNELYDERPTLIRARIDKEYDRMGIGTDEYSGSSSGRSPNYIQPTADGYPGLEAPVG
jgi:hypothetical protein